MVALSAPIYAAKFFLFNTETASVGSNSFWIEDGRAFNVANSSDIVKFRTPDKLNPKANQGWLLGMWMNLRKLPSDGSRWLYFSSYQSETPNRPGIALGLEGYRGQVRPIVYWRGEKGEGGWYTYSSLQLLPRQWYFVTAYFNGEGVLSTYVLDEKQILAIGGAHFVESSDLPVFASDMSVGAVGDGNFKGRLAMLRGLALSPQEAITSNLLATLSLRSDTLDFESTGASLLLDLEPHKVEVLLNKGKHRARKKKTVHGAPN